MLWLMLAAREVKEERAVFSPNELVFGITMHRPLNLSHEQLKGPESPKNLFQWL